MEKINFQNGTTPALNATNLNQMQTNIENAINGIVESGSNSNGSWTKLADGTMICRYAQEITTAVTSAWGSMYISPVITLQNYPIAFIGDLPDISICCENSVQSAWTMNASASSLAAPNKIQLCRAETSGSKTFKISVIAIGKWK